MKNYYFIAKQQDNEYDNGRVYSTTQKIEKGDYVVIPDYDDEPIIAKVEKVVSEFEAITKFNYINEIIQVVNMKDFNKKRENEIRKKMLNVKMNDKVSEIKALEVLEKYAGKDTEMAELLATFKNLNGLNETEKQEQEVDED